MEIVKETTEWSVITKQPNHTYLLDGNKIIAYAKWGSQEVCVVPSKMQLDKRRRTFVKVHHAGLANIAKSQTKKPNTRVFKVKSGENEYLVELSENRYSCTCAGFNFRGKCKHIDAVAKKQQ
jgi:hypothetical protein